MYRRESETGAVVVIAILMAKEYCALEIVDAGEVTETQHTSSEMDPDPAGNRPRSRSSSILQGLSERLCSAIYYYQSVKVVCAESACVAVHGAPRRNRGDSGIALGVIIVALGV